MNNFLRYIVSFAIALVFVACAKNNKASISPENPETKLADVNLDGKSTENILKTKYNKAILICSLWLQFGTELNRSNNPNDTFSFDLLKGEINNDTLKLSGKTQSFSSDIKIQIKQLAIEHVNHTDVDGTVYRMKYTPVVRLEIVNQVYKGSENGLIFSGNGVGKRIIYEKIKDKSLDESFSTPGDIRSYFNYIECIIDTDIKSEYRDQFVVENNK